MFSVCVSAGTERIPNFQAAAAGAGCYVAEVAVLLVFYADAAGVWKGGGFSFFLGEEEEDRFWDLGLFMRDIWMGTFYGYFYGKSVRENAFIKRFLEIGFT
jgi:hypothetical protein